MSDDRQPGGNEQDGVEAMTRLPVAQGSRESVDWNGGSGAGSTVDQAMKDAALKSQKRIIEAQQKAMTQLRAAVEAAQTDVAAWRDIATHLRAHFEIADQQRRDLTADEQLAQLGLSFDELVVGYQQSRATEAELRARVERLTAWVRSRTKADALSDEQIGKDVDQWYIGLPAALDAAEQPAPPKTAPRVRSANASASDDRSDLETAEGPL